MARQHTDFLHFCTSNESTLSFSRKCRWILAGTYLLATSGNGASSRTAMGIICSSPAHVSFTASETGCHQQLPMSSCSTRLSM